MYKRMKWITGIFLCLMLTAFFVNVQAAGINYSDRANWAYHGNPGADVKDVDVFFVCPTVFMGSKTQFNMPIDDADIRQKFIGAINMEKGIYDVNSNFFAPFYRQAGIIAYRMKPVLAAPFLDLAYQDVKAAFQYYLKHENHGRPFVLAGFSQGADMVLRLIKDMFGDNQLQNQLVAVYAIGWRVTPEEIVRYPYMKMAQGERDTGVIVSFNTEAINVNTSMIVPQKTLGINPLNWKITDEPADKSLNKGAAFIGYDGIVKKEILHLTGAYLEPTRGTLKVTDIVCEDYPPLLTIFENGVYHIYDYQFFYRNLQENVKARIETYIRQPRVTWGRRVA